MDEVKSELLTLRDIARLSGSCEQFWRREIQRGHLVAIRLPIGFRVRRVDFERYLEERSTRAETAKK